MKKFNKSGTMTLRRVIGNLLNQRRFLPILAVAAGFLSGSNAVGDEINLVTGSSGFVNPDNFTTGTSAGGSGTIYRLIDTIPAGTGVFQPFLSYQQRGEEEGVNTSLGGSGQGFLDDKRVPKWNHDVHLNELGQVDINLKPVSSGGYYAFELDANETGVGNPNRLLSIDDIRIYTKSSNPFSSNDNDTKVSNRIAGDTLGTLRYAQNSPSTSTANWVLIDASRRTEGSTSGSGSSDMIVLVPTSLFAGAGANDFLTFYTKNGSHDTAGDDGSDAGFEEWRFLSGTPSVPDGGSTLLLLGSALIPLGLLRARRESNKA